MSNPYNTEPLKESDPVENICGNWYFWDETWTSRHGPYEDEAAARAALERYASEYL